MHLLSIAPDHLGPMHYAPHASEILKGITSHTVILHHFPKYGTPFRPIFRTRIFYKTCLTLKEYLQVPTGARRNHQHLERPFAKQSVTLKSPSYAHVADICMPSASNVAPAR